MSRLTEQQERAVKSIDKHVLVSAGAGSGKTHVLVERYLEILANAPNLSCARGIIAVTYTKKAANEMRSRLRRRMDELVALANEAGAKQRWIALADEIDGARIGTIHSLCESILKAYPVEANVDPNFEVLDELERAELVASCVKRAILQALAESDEAKEMLAEYPVENVREWVEKIVFAPLLFDEALKVMPGTDDDALKQHSCFLLLRLRRAAIQLITTCSEWRSAVSYLKAVQLDSKNKLEEIRRNVVESIKQLEQLLEEDDDKRDIERCYSLLLYIQAAIELKVGGRDEFSREVKEALKGLRELIKSRLKGLEPVSLDLDHLSYRFTRTLIVLAKRAMDIYSKAKKRSQKLDFDDLIDLTSRLLLMPDSIARRNFNSEIEAILVDEFQDTNETQAKLISLLAGPKTRLFFIGDDKQSIYRFQGADVSIFNAWREYLSGERQLFKDEQVVLSGPGFTECLDISFRSHPSIVNCVNKVFDNLFNEEYAGLSHAAKHQALKAFRSDDAEEQRVDVVIYDLDKEGLKIDAVNSKFVEAHLVVDWIEEKCAQKSLILDKSGRQRPIDFGDFAILVERNADFKIIESVLSRRDIPYVAMGGSGFLQSQEILDMECLFRFVACPVDSHSLLGILRSPLFAITDDLLHGLKAGKASNLWFLLKEAVEKSEDDGPLKQAYLLLSQLIRDAWSRPLTVFVEQAIRDTNYDVIQLALPNGYKRARNLLKLVTLARERPHLSIGEFAQYLSSMRKRKIKQAAAPIDLDKSVKLLTIHGAKGLEFPAVALPVLGASAQHVTDKIKLDRQYGLAFDTTKRKEEEKPSLYRLACLIEKQMSQAEKRRLLYVAMTRARDYLSMFVRGQGKNIPSFRLWLNSALNLSLVESESKTQTFLQPKEASITPYNLKNSKADSFPSPLVTKTDWELTKTEALDHIEKMSLELIEPIGGQIEPASYNWQELLRVTTTTSNLKVEPVVLGKFFHALMERFSSKMERLSCNIIEDAAFSLGASTANPDVRQKLFAEGSALLERFYESELYLLMCKAKNRFHELPYLISRAPEDFHEKRPDLIVEGAQGNLYVVDFKTDHFNLDELDKQVLLHREQLEQYRQDLEMLLSKPVRMAIYFAQQGILRWVDS